MSPALWTFLAETPTVEAVITDLAMPMAASTAIADLPAPAMQRVRGEGRLVTQMVDGRTRIATLYQEGAAKAPRAAPYP